MNEASHATWRKSLRSTQEGGQCVELAELGAGLGVRDSVDPDGPVLRFGRSAMAALVTRIKDGELGR